MTVFNVGDQVEYIGTETRRLRGCTGVVSHVYSISVGVKWDKPSPYGYYNVANRNVKLVELDIPGDNDDDCI